MDRDQMLKDANSRSFKPVELNVRLKETIVTKVRSFASRNVVARVPGSDPKLKNQAVMYTAHSDHLGIHRDAPGDNIYNGPAHNATGFGTLLELARTHTTAENNTAPSSLF